MDTIPTKEIPISKIIIDDKILPREKISEKHVNNLAKALEEGAELPPLDIFYDFIC